ncbi:hypothetical protein M514_13218 [Trichuris suis]|uniref:Uncharacterized protein n=1 Tax=Trichuris suis TaxID=68888 RepID=A0A085N377_9BILA|nr:hypothetical protein M513_13218 [Trichuris suis]KFD63923.1 hypothetical protein M514_13218 [Trichuris suis]
MRVCFCMAIEDGISRLLASMAHQQEQQQQMLEALSVVSRGNATQGQETSMAIATRLPLALTTNNTENPISGGLRWKNGGGMERRRVTVGCVCVVRSGE